MDGWLRIGTEIETKDFDSQISYIEQQMEEIEHKLKQADMGFEVGDTTKLEAKYETLGNKLLSLKQKQEDLNKIDISGFEKQMKKANKETTNIIKKMGKWALGIFAIESAYGFVRQTISTLTSYNEKLGADVEYIRFALASALQPIIEKLVSWVYKLLNAVNYIAQAWFGVNLFANASADAMKKSSKSAKDMKKSLAGFDEMNTVSSSSSSDASGASPSHPLNEIKGDVPDWIKWIADNGELIKKIIIGIGIAIGSLKLANLLKTLGLFSKLPLWQLVGGIGLIIAGVALAIKGVIDFIKDPSWNNFLTILQGISLVVAGIAVLCGAWVVAIAALGVAIVAAVIKNWDKVKEILGAVGQWIYDYIVVPVINFFKGLFDTIWSIIKLWFSYVTGIFTTIVGIITNPFIVAKDTILGVFNGIKTFFSGFVQVIKSLFTGDIKGALNGFKTMFKGIMDSLWSIAKAPLNLIIGGLNSLIKGINKISFDVPDWVPGLGGKKFGFNIKQIPKLKSGGIINMPGRGVPLGIGGEAGREGVIPLTDSQAMEELGSAIGRYITINATMINQMNGRTISRELRAIQNESNFAMNR